MSEAEESGHEIDWLVFGVSLGVVLCVSIVLVPYPQAGSGVIEAVFAFLTQGTGAWFLLAGVGCLAFLLVLALSPCRKVHLGAPGERPVYPTWSWAGMLFSTGIGTALLYWSAIEWMEYSLAPPFDLEPRSSEAQAWAMSYGIFHWGPIGWAFYALPTVCLCHAYHVRGARSPSLANACEPLLGPQVNRWPGRCINAIFMIGLIGSASTGLGLTTPFITEAASALLGVEFSFAFTLGAVVLVIGLIALSVSLGLDRGIRRLSNLNLVLMLALLLIVYLSGPTLAITRQGVESVSFVAGHFLEMSGVHYPERNQAFTESWTVFYWAWWLALGPFVGMFICKISRGRSLGQVIWGVLGLGSLGCTVSFVILGGYSFSLSANPERDLLASFAESKHGTVIEVLTTLPLGHAILPLFGILCITFAATTYDSAAYTLAAAATRDLPVKADPQRWHRVLWAGALGLLPLSLLSLGQQDTVLRALQTASVVVALPMMAVLLLMWLAFLRALVNGKK